MPAAFTLQTRQRKKSQPCSPATKHDKIWVNKKCTSPCICSSFCWHPCPLPRWRTPPSSWVHRWRLSMPTEIEIFLYVFVFHVMYLDISSSNGSFQTEIRSFGTRCVQFSRSVTIYSGSDLGKVPDPVRTISSEVFQIKKIWINLAFLQLKQHCCPKSFKLIKH